ncbi:MAG: kinase [Candidatus Moraniibacteriota bacterium]|nr:MAG: kinase [Candidatus Moranbacteria bacterium]
MKNATTLIVLRGPSGAGKSTIAKTIQDRELAQGRKMAYVEQDYFRRTILKERDLQGGYNAELIKIVTILLLQEGYNVIMEGIFNRDRYQEMFQSILAEHPVQNFFFYFDISFEETLKRHKTKPNCHEFGEEEMKSWYKEKNFLDCIREEAISERSELEETVEYIRTFTAPL